MIDSHAKTTTFRHWQSRKRTNRSVGVAAAAPYVTILALLCLLSTVWALKDPLIFADIFSRM